MAPLLLWCGRRIAEAGRGTPRAGDSSYGNSSRLQSCERQITGDPEGLSRKVSAKIRTSQEDSRHGHDRQRLSVARDELADIAVEAVKSVVDEDGTVDTDNITVEKKVGGDSRHHAGRRSGYR